MSFNNCEYLHSYCSSSIYYFINFFSLLSLLVSIFLIFSLSYLCFFFPSLSLPIHSLLQWVWSTSSFLIHSLLVLFVGVDFSLNGSDQPWVSAWMGLGFGLIWVSAPINHENEKQNNHKAWVWEIWASSWWWPVAAPGILFRGVIKKF